MKRLRDEDDDRSSDGSDDGEDLKDFIVDVADAGDDERVDTKSSEDLDLIIQESKKITSDLKATVVGGRVLRDRSSLKKPETYFDHENYRNLMIQETKKEQIAMLKDWAKEGVYVCPILKTLNKKSDADLVDCEYKKAKRAMELPDTDDEDEEEDDEDEDEDDDEEEDEEDDDDDDDEEEEEEEEEEE
jgi:E3 ubiquitin-protein ligase HUWE1